MDSKMFLCVCSRLMQGGKNAEYIGDFNRIYNEVYGSEKILAKLKKSDFPDSPGIQQKYDELLDSLENAVIIPELIGKSVYSLSGTSNSKIIESYGNRIFKFGSTKLAALESNIPIIICNSEDKYKVEVINYLNQRIELEQDEIDLLTEGEKQGIAIDKIIRFFIVHIPMHFENVVMILGDASELSSYITYTFDLKISERETENAITEMQKLAGTVNYGYLEKCDCITSAIECYFYKEIKSVRKSTILAITDDIVRIGSKASEVFGQLRQNESSRCNQLEDQIKDISETICVFRLQIENLIKNFVLKQYDYNAADIKSTLFEIFFNYISYNDWNQAKNCASEISKSDANAGSLADEYIKLCQKKKKRMSVIDETDLTWYLTKFIIEGMDVKNTTFEKIILYSEVLGDYVSTGKEYFVKALAATDDEKTDLLMKSMSLGYEDAGQYLVNLTRDSLTTDIEKRLLVAIVPEICLNYKGKNSKVYVKMAAAMGSLKAISLLVDEYFDKNFKKLTQLYKPNGNSKYINTKLAVGNNLINMCNYLIEEKFMINHYKEIKGEVLFCLHKDYVQAMQCLYEINTDGSNFCKAKMYEFGYGVTIDYEKAKNHYDKIQDKDTYNLQKSIKRVQDKYEEIIEVDNDDYDDDNDYSESRSSSYSSSDGCFVEGTRILMADGTSKSVENVEEGDKVLVFDHYKGVLAEETIIANIHADEDISECIVLKLSFENDSKLNIAVSHALFDCTYNQYVWIDQTNVSDYIGHRFLMVSGREIKESRLVLASQEKQFVKYYAPISRFHLNVIAEGLISMVPNDFSINLFKINADLKYDVTVLRQTKLVSYEEISSLISKSEFDNLPICYLKAIMEHNNVNIKDLMSVICLLRKNRNLKSKISI